MTFPRGLSAVATGQLGSFSRRQAHAAGMTDHELRRRVQSGALVQVGPHAFRGALVPPTAIASLTALLLDVGEPCWIAGPTAAAMHGFDGFVLAPPFHLVTERDRNVRRIGHHVHSTRSLPVIDRGRVGGLPVTRGARTLGDLAGDAGVTDERLAAAYDSGLRDGRFSERSLHQRITALRRSGRRGLPRLLDVVSGREIATGGHSWLEREFLRLVHAAGLPAPLTQQTLSRRGDRLVRVDVRFPGTRVVVELLGYRFHRSTDDVRRDTERLNALVLDGFAPYQFTYLQVVEEPGPTIDVVRAALAADAAAA